MDTDALRFYPGSGPTRPMPLARYLPPLPPGMAAAWLAENAPPGSWLLDPLGASPALALEAARAGYRVLVASNNPILNFILETLAEAPKLAEFQAALAELAATRRGEERLEKHLSSLYRTDCAVCGESVTAQAFLWRKGEEQPFARLYRCPKCGDTGERPVTPADLERLAGMGGDKLQRARALQRVIMNEDEYRVDVEEALENYLSRPLYVLFTLLNKAEGLGLPPERLRLLHALLISAFDAGSTLWPWPSGRARPRQLIVPPQFRENNLWNAMEEAAEQWSGQPGPVPVTYWPQQPPKEGGICLFRGRVKALSPLPEEVAPQAVLAAFPRPNQAFWTLSVLWSGWLWGREATLPLRNVLDRRRYDWNWHTSAVHSALAAIGWSLPSSTPFFGLLPELAPGFLSAVVVAAEAGGFRLQELATREDQEIAQALWRPSGIAAAARPGDESESDNALSGEALERAARAAMRADLLARGEPASYLTEYAVGLQALAQAGAIPRRLSSIPGGLLTRIQAGLARTFADRSFLKLYSSRGAGGSQEDERGWWWLANPADAPGETPLADRIEMETVRFLQKNPDCAFDDLDAFLCAKFRGLSSPPQGLVRAILESYAEPNPAQADHWRLRPGETSAARRADLESARAGLETLGQALGYVTRDEQGALAWCEQDGTAAWWFYRMASSIISRFVLNPPPGPAERCVLLLPGSRAPLLSFKLHRDPRLAEAAQPWRLLKFRHLRTILERQGLTRADWEAMLGEDPLTDEATQMALFLG